MILEIITTIVVAWLVCRHWEWLKLTSAVFAVMTVLIALEIASYIYYAVHYIFNLVRKGNS